MDQKAETNYIEEKPQQPDKRRPKTMPQGVFKFKYDITPGGGGVRKLSKKRDNHYITSLNKKRDNGGG